MRIELSLLSKTSKEFAEMENNTTLSLTKYFLFYFILESMDIFQLKKKVVCFPVMDFYWFFKWINK